jgi:hypothetical protein
MKDIEAESLKKLGEMKSVEEGVKAAEEEGPVTNGDGGKSTSNIRIRSLTYFLLNLL